jgi:hypothetical protein
MAPVKTRKGLRAHHAMILNAHGRGPCPAGRQLQRTFVNAIAFFGECGNGVFRCHTHRGHGRYEEIRGYLHSRHWLAIRLIQLDAHSVRTLARRRWLRAYIDQDLCRGCGIHACSRLLREGRIGSESRLKLRFGIHQEVGRANHAVARL